MVERMIAAIDDSVISPAVVESAITLAQSMQAHLKLLHVLTAKEQPQDPPLEDVLERDVNFNFRDPEWLRYSPGMYEDIRSAYQHQLEQEEKRRMAWMTPYLNQCREAGIVAEPLQIPGDPGPVICEYGRLLRCCSIVVGRRGRTGLSELLLGSVSNYVLHHASCPVLVVNVSRSRQRAAAV